MLKLSAFLFLALTPSCVFVAPRNESPACCQGGGQQGTCCSAEAEVPQCCADAAAVGKECPECAK